MEMINWWMRNEKKKMLVSLRQKKGPNTHRIPGLPGTFLPSAAPPAPLASAIALFPCRGGCWSSQML